MPEDPRLVELEILKALHSAKFNRWEKRRSYEWLLSYAIWGALAGFIAVVAFGKDSRFEAPSPWILTLILGFTVAVHAFYLYFMVENTLVDLAAQHELEAMIKQLSSYEERPADDQDQPNPLPRTVSETADSRITLWLKTVILRWKAIIMPFLKPRYGFLAQTAITILLCMAAEWAALRPAPLPMASTPAQPASVCEGCSQYFTPPLVNQQNTRNTIGQDGPTPKTVGKSAKPSHRLP